MVSFGRIAAVALGKFALCVTGVSQPRAASWLEMNFWLTGPRYERDERAEQTLIDLRDCCKEHWMAIFAPVRGNRPTDAPGSSDDAIATGATSVADIEKLMWPSY